VNWLLDTDTVVYYLREMPTVVSRLEATRVSSRYLSLITLGELYFGIFRSVQVEKNLRRFRRFRAKMKHLPLPQQSPSASVRSKPTSQGAVK
jgi:predicted nucleic acid-binding protein